MPDRESEFDFIARALAPLAEDAPNAFGLKDDTAVLEQAGELARIVVTTDMLVEGVHFLPVDPRGAVAQKALRVNLSDLAAKGAEPFAYVLSIAWPRDTGRAYRDAFVAGLAADQREFRVALLGGDTNTTPGPFTVSVTAFGRTGERGPVMRSGAALSDAVFVTGAIGDAALGLKQARGEDIGADDAGGAYLLDRYRRPQARTPLANVIAANASASIDVSDGLFADAEHLASASGVRLDIDAMKLPLSSPAAAWVSRQPDNDRARAVLAAGGDDYEILFTAPESASGRVASACASLGVDCTKIGSVTEGAGVIVRGDGGRTLENIPKGFTHF